MKISSIVPEGTVVKQGDVVAELDRTTVAPKLQEVSLALQKAEEQYEQAMLDSTLNLSTARENIRTMELGLEEKRLAKEQAVYEAPTVKRQAEIDYEKAQRALGLLVIDLRLALDSGRLVDGLFLGEPLLLEPELHRANVLPRRGKVERRVEHRLLVLLLRLLQGEGHFLEFRGDGGPVELGDDVPLLHHGAFGHDRRDLHLEDAGLLPAGRRSDLHELARAQLARRGDDYRERPALHGCHYHRIRAAALTPEEPGAGQYERQYGCSDAVPACGKEAHVSSSRGRGRTVRQATVRHRRDQFRCEALPLWRDRNNS